MTDVTLPITVAKARAALATATQYEEPDDDPTPVMVSSFYGSLAWRLTGRVEIGYFKQIADTYHEHTVGHITRNPGDGPRVAALIAPYHEHIANNELDEAANTRRLAKLLEHLALVDPDMLVVIPDHEYDDKARFVPLGSMDYEFYDPEGDYHPGTWGYDPGDGPAVLALWPASSFTPSPPPATPTPLAPAKPTPPAPAAWFIRLAQTETWTDEYDKPHRIAAMTPLQAYSALSWLDIHARRISSDVIDYLLGNSAEALMTSPARAPLLESAVAVADPRGWIASTPLALALAVKAA
ncbi:hypothetical protein ACWDRB_47345 [Nonomuraea sp. NPDC003707]